MNQERFKELETHVDAFLEAFQKNAKIKPFNENVIRKLYRSFVEDICEWTNAKIKREYGVNYANRKVDPAAVIFDKDDENKVVKYAKEYNATKAASDLNRIKLVLDSEGDHIHNHYMYEKLAHGYKYIDIEGGEGCRRCPCGNDIEIEDGMKLPPFHPGCLCHIVKFHNEVEE